MKCIVLSGATVPFHSLVRSIDHDLLSLLKGHGYDQIEVQYGHALASFQPQSGVTGFDFDPAIQNRIKQCDLIISHAGSGSILDSIERGVGEAKRKVVVVINDQLMDNHQRELALKLEQLGCVQVALSPVHLKAAVSAACSNKYKQFEPPKSIANILRQDK